MKKNRLVLSIAGCDFIILLSGGGEEEMFRQKYSDYLVESADSNSTNDCVVELCRGNVTQSLLVSRNRLRISIHEYLRGERFFRRFDRVFYTAVQYWISLHGGLFIHASSVILENQGLVFMGRSGAGKSTLLSLMKGFESLGDDVALVRLIDNKIWLYGSPFYQRTNHAYPNKIVPVFGFFNLIQADQFRVRELAFPETYVKLLTNCVGKSRGLNQLVAFPTLSKNALTLVNTQLALICELEFSRDTGIGDQLDIFMKGRTDD